MVDLVSPNELEDKKERLRSWIRFRVKASGRVSKDKLFQDLRSQGYEKREIDSAILEVLSEGFGIE